MFMGNLISFRIRRKRASSSEFRVRSVDVVCASIYLQPRRPRLVCSSSSSTAGAIEGGLAGDSLSSGVQYGLSDGLGTTPLVFEPQVQLLSTDVLVGTSGASLTSEKTSAVSVHLLIK